MIELKLETMKLKIAGEEYEMTLPYGDSVDALNEKLQKDENKGRELRLMREFFVEHGLPEDVCKKLQLPHYNQIMSGMMPKES